MHEKTNVISYQYLLPDGADFQVPVAEDDLLALEQYVERPDPVTAEYKELFDTLREDQQEPKSILDCARLYAFIKDAL
jgi:hypothetical protein